MSIDASTPLSLGVSKARRASNERSELRSCESLYRAIGAEPLGAPKARIILKLEKMCRDIFIVSIFG